jgi:hypothetical protein
MATQDVVVLNDFGFERRDRNAGKGVKSRYTVTIAAEAIVHNFDPVALGMAPAQAIAKVIRDRIRDIAELAKPATIQRRQQAAKSLAAGSNFDRTRYTGGRTGSKPPNQTSRLFNDSGRLADGIHARPNLERGKEQLANWTINVPANRLNPSTGWNDASKFQAMVARLQTLVPELSLQGASKLGQAKEVRDAIADSVAHVMVTRLQMAQDVASAARTAIRKAQFQILAQLAAIASELGAL